MQLSHAAKGKDKKRYQELQAELGCKYRESSDWINSNNWKACVELEAADAKGNFSQLFQILKSMTRKFQPRLTPPSGVIPLEFFQGY